MQRPVINTETGSNPGAPLAWGSPENPDDAVAGYGYVPCDTSEVEETFFRGGKRGFITHYRSMGSLGYFNGDPVNLGQDFSFHEVNGLCIPVRTKDNFSHGINDIIDAFNKK